MRKSLVWTVLIAACSANPTEDDAEPNVESILPGPSFDAGTGGEAGADALALDVGTDAPQDTGSDVSPDGPNNVEDVSVDGDAELVLDASEDADAEPVLDASEDASEDAEDAHLCMLGAFRCDGSILEQCNATQTGFEVVQDCYPLGCDEGVGSCQICVPSSVSCIDDWTRRDCAVDGLGYDDVICPGMAPFCEDPGECVVCREDGDCPDPGECERVMCDTGDCVADPLPAGEICGDEGVCNGEYICGECVPGDQRCVGLDRENCNHVGEWISLEACAFVCAQGECMGECVPGGVECFENTPRVCSVDGIWLSEDPCGGSEPECFKGGCVRATPPSCVGLPIDCGKEQDDRCCASVLIPGGTFSRSYDGVSFKEPAYVSTVDPFDLDVYEVTVGRFRSFVDHGGGTKLNPPAAGDGKHPQIANSGWQASWNTYLESTSGVLRGGLGCSQEFSTWTDSPAGNENRPINCVTWFEAFAFCVWDGGRIPTEAEWNFAAAGGDEQRVYPWSIPSTSTSITAENASFWENGTVECSGDGVAGCTVEDLVPVGSKLWAGAGRWGNDALAGNVWEWVLDTYAHPYEITPCNNCAWLGGADKNRVLRGGAFFGNRSTLYASTRNPGGPMKRYYTAGIRCARDVP